MSYIGNMVKKASSYLAEKTIQYSSDMKNVPVWARVTAGVLVPILGGGIAVAGAQTNMEKEVNQETGKKIVVVENHPVYGFDPDFITATGDTIPGAGDMGPVELHIADGDTSYAYPMNDSTDVERTCRNYPIMNHKLKASGCWDRVENSQEGNIVYTKEDIDNINRTLAEANSGLGTQNNPKLEAYLHELAKKDTKK